ncbi:MAG: TetR/AcrR family transcriptional regulator [SAR324 cluster bacterium]|nr:TetR/AcrR family transcriptional regulator [SAR324 cluster bacterium]
MKPESQKQLTRSAVRRQREREDRYQTLLRAAESLFAREGYHQTSINQIADLAEVSVGTVYFYFKNKEDLLIQLYDEICYLFRSMIGAEFKKSEASLEGIKRAGYLFFDQFCSLYPDKLAILYRETVGQSPALTEHRRQFQRKIIGDVQGALQRASENMGFSFPSADSSEVIAVSIIGIYDCIVSYFLLSKDPSLNMKAIGEDAVSFLTGGIKSMCR